MNNAGKVLAFGLAAAGVLALLVTAERVAAQEKLAPGYKEIFQASETYCEGLTQADKAKVQTITTPELWSRLAPSFSSSPAPKSFGEFESLVSGQMVKTDYAQVHVHCRHPDGVEDVLTLTLKKVGGQWRVCGGPTAVSPTNPLKVQ